MTLAKFAEILASALGFIAVWLNVKEKIWAWPIGLAGVLAAAYVYYQSRLFAEFYLHLFYAVTNIYGWYSWYILAGRSVVKKAPISTLNVWQWVMVIIVGLMASWAITELMLYFHTPDMVWADSAIAGFSLVGQFLLTRKFIENWILWIVIDAACVLLYIIKGLEFFVLLYIGFLWLAVRGWLSWRKSAVNL